jgi:glucokinase
MAAWARGQAPANDSYRTAKQICQLALEGDELASKVVDREVYYLGLGIANLINLFVPDRIVLGGSVMLSARLFLDGIRKQIARGCLFVPHEKTELALASLGKNANLIGAASVWHNRFGNSLQPTSSSAV